MLCHPSIGVDEFASGNYLGCMPDTLVLATRYLRSSRVDLAFIDFLLAQLLTIIVHVKLFASLYKKKRWKNWDIAYVNGKAIWDTVALDSDTSAVTTHGGKSSGSSFKTCPFAEMPYSFHSHSGQFCHHGYGQLEDVVKEAIRKGFKVYGLSEHMPRFERGELYPEEIEAS